MLTTERSIVSIYILQIKCYLKRQQVSLGLRSFLCENYNSCTENNSWREFYQKIFAKIFKHSRNISFNEIEKFHDEPKTCPQIHFV